MKGQSKPQGSTCISCLKLSPEAGGLAEQGRAEHCSATPGQHTARRSRGVTVPICCVIVLVCPPHDRAGSRSALQRSAGIPAPSRLSCMDVSGQQQPVLWGWHPEEPRVAGEETKLSLFSPWEPATLCAGLLLTAGCQRVSVTLGGDSVSRDSMECQACRAGFEGQLFSHLSFWGSLVQKQMQNQPFVHTHIIKKVFIQRDRLEGQPSVSIQAGG